MVCKWVMENKEVVNIGLNNHSKHHSVKFTSLYNPDCCSNYGEAIVKS